MGQSITAQSSTKLAPAHANHNTARAANLIPAIASDGGLFPIDKMEAHRTGLLHQAVSVFVFSGNEILIQRRAAAKYHCGRQWANTCCTHPYWNESLAEAAHRRTFEELGFFISLVPTRAITYSTPVSKSLFEHELVQLYRGVAEKKNLRILPNPDEVMETRWATPDRLRAEIRAQPLSFAPWFRIYLKRWDELGFQ
jgi:isopentenyl-diphosphate delta-isomerase